MRNYWPLGQNAMITYWLLFLISKRLSLCGDLKLTVSIQQQICHKPREPHKQMGFYIPFLHPTPCHREVHLIPWALDHALPRPLSSQSSFPKCSLIWSEQVLYDLCIPNSKYLLPNLKCYKARQPSSGSGISFYAPQN